MYLSVSAWPLSIRSTRCCGSSDKREATTHPLEPPPTTMKSYSCMSHLRQRQISLLRSRSAEHALDGGKLLQPFHAEFDTEPGLFHAAERGVRLNCATPVDPDGARLDPLHYAFCALEIGTPDRAAEAHRGRV